MEYKKLLDLYKGKYACPEVGYGTVRDFADSRINLADLCGLNGDLKNIQRAWMVKAILGSVPIGSNILEIGAGEPIVADILTNLGYNVTIVDPYDGSGNGPTHFDEYKKRYPAINIIRRLFDENLSMVPKNSFDAVYSISVLEHVPAEKTFSLAKATKLFLKNGGKNIHVIDHVFMGLGQEFHETQLDNYFKGFGIKEDYKVVLNKLKDDVETYFMSAEGHLFWMGDTAYNNFPFRKVVSINLNIS
ncbi:MAG: methyltransferase domain-containing protein [Ferruginibacter sp.]